MNLNDPLGETVILPNDDKIDLSKKALNRIGHYAGLKFTYRELTDEEADREIADDDLTPEDRALRRNEVRRQYTAVDVDDAPGTRTRSPGVSRQDVEWPHRSKLLRERILDAIRAAANIRICFFFKERAFYMFAVFLTWEWDGKNCLEQEPTDPDNPIIRFAHELWRALYDPDPDGTGEGGTRDHAQGDAFLEDPVWTEGEKPVRDELGMPKPTGKRGGGD